MPDEEKKLTREAVLLPETEGFTPDVERVESSPDASIAESERSPVAEQQEKELPVVPHVEQASGTVEQLRRERDPLFKAVDTMLSDKLMPLFEAMSKAQQDRFREHGEQLTKQIRDIIAHGKLRRHHAHKLIAKWLRRIPKVIDPWVGQEAELRAEDLLQLQEKEQRKAA